MIQEELSEIHFIIDVKFELQVGCVAVMEETTKYTTTRREVIVIR
jgi:hypothetical protein